MADRAAPTNVSQLAVSQLVADHHEALFRYAYRLSGSVADAEDLTQQAFLVAQQKLEQVRDAASVRAWLFTVLRNGYFKSRRRNLALPVAEIDVTLVAETPAVQPFDSEELQLAINTLADEFKLVVLMFYFEHRSYREIAELLEVPIGTVMSRLARAKAHLRGRLTDQQAERRTDEPPGPTTQNQPPISEPLSRTVAARH